MADEIRHCERCGKELRQSTYWYCTDEQIQVPWGAPFPGTTAAAGAIIENHFHVPAGDLNVTATVATASEFRLQGSTTPPPIDTGE